MTDNVSNIRSLKWWTLLVCLPLVSGALQVHLPSLWGGFLGDSAVYYAMSDSLAYDFDLQYTRNDLLRITAEWAGGPQGILLVADKEDPTLIHYAKPLLYSLAGAPLVRFFKVNGLLLLNALCFTCLILLGCMAFPGQEHVRPVETVLWSLVFWGLSAVPAYIFSVTPDLFNGTLLMAGLIPWVHHNHSSHPFRMLVLSTVLISIAATSRPPNALFLLLPFWSITFGSKILPVSFPDHTITKRILQRTGHLLLLLGAAALGAGLMYLVSHTLTGQGFAYSGFRKRIVGHFPFEFDHFTFLNTGDVISTETTRFIFNWDTLFHNLYYFFVGRFAGLIPYFFPAFAILASRLFHLGKRTTSTELEKSLPSRLPVWLVLSGLYLFHLVYIPSNWHGGSCAVGNRYLISWLPGFFLLLRSPPKMKFVVITAFFTALFSGIVALSPATAFRDYRDIPKQPILKMFPMEITLLESWPVDDLAHRRVDFGSYFIYFSDDNQFGRENDGFWVRGRSRTDFVMRCWKPAERIVLKIRNGGRAGRISGRVGSARFRFKADAGQYMELDLEPGKPVRAYNLAGNVSFCYPVVIRVTNGFVPRFFEPGSTDHRFLGCHAILETHP